MASKDELTDKFAEFCSPNKGQLTSSNCKKLYTDCLASALKGKFKDIDKRIDSSVFSKCIESKNKFIIVNKANCEKFLRLTALECIKIKEKKDRVPEDDPQVMEQYGVIKGIFLESKGKSQATVKMSKTGGVDRMTDASKYTGAHKERFTADGKGKGIEGREERHDHTGYTGQYKGQDTYDAKK